ncbi:phosphoribosyltransferase family protein [Archangium primigenium]|uniref:phosphoribosyltransferase family protein n=1 Tax=[Archangium] primigenium TaxID=2792470 RepID=UPI00195984BC|nr:ComF family protein [Archangium primigenium]
MLQHFLDLLYPPACIACAKVLPVRGAFCETCDLAVERLPTARCHTCAEPGAFPRHTCPRCHDAPPPFTRAWAAFAHEGPIARAIHRFKYEDHPELAPALAALLVSECGRFLARAPPTLVALPLHGSRFRERGYDQAWLLAQALARATGREADPDVLRRARATRRQVGLSEAERALNVADAFRATASAAGRDFLLVDDVLTTGATVRAAAQALLDAGARRVEVLTLARAFSLA